VARGAASRRLRPRLESQCAAAVHPASTTAPPSQQQLLPLAFGAHAAALLALTDSPVNVHVADAAAEAGARTLGSFELALVGGPLLLGAIAIAVLSGGRLPPHRTARRLPPDFSQHAAVLWRQYRPDRRTFRLRIARRSRYVGPRRAVLDLRDNPGLDLVGVQEPGGAWLAAHRATPAAAVAYRSETSLWNDSEREGACVPDQAPAVRR
jgi:hypothetical protein